MSSSPYTSSASDRAEAEKTRDEIGLDQEQGKLDHGDTEESADYASGLKLVGICVALVLTIFLVRR